MSHLSLLSKKKRSFLSLPYVVPFSSNFCRLLRYRLNRARITRRFNPFARRKLGVFIAMSVSSLRHLSPLPRCLNSCGLWPVPPTHGRGRRRFPPRDSPPSIISPPPSPPRAAHRPEIPLGDGAARTDTPLAFPAAQEEVRSALLPPIRATT